MGNNIIDDEVLLPNARRVGIIVDSERDDGKRRSMQFVGNVMTNVHFYLWYQLIFSACRNGSFSVDRARVGGMVMVGVLPHVLLR